MRWIWIRILGAFVCRWNHKNFDSCRKMGFCLHANNQFVRSYSCFHGVSETSLGDLKLSLLHLETPCPATCLLNLYRKLIHQMIQRGSLRCLRYMEISVMNNNQLLSSCRLSTQLIARALIPASANHSTRSYTHAYMRAVPLRKHSRARWHIRRMSRIVISSKFHLYRMRVK